jgi:antitoxin HicB
MLIQRSERDDVFVVTLPEWEGYAVGPVPHGDSDVEAAQRGREDLQLLVEETLASGDDLPMPSQLAGVG